jgi:hypothetical protein
VGEHGIGPAWARPDERANEAANENDAKAAKNLASDSRGHGFLPDEQIGAAMAKRITA